MVRLTASRNTAGVLSGLRSERHVQANRERYRKKFSAVLPILEPVLSVPRPEAAFYLWPDVGSDDETFARELFARKNITALPGTYLARDTDAGNPGRNRIRLSLVAEVDQCVEAATRIRDFLSEH